MTTDCASEIQSRAGWALEQRYPGPHKDKRIAGDLSISPDMAALLRRGRGWTIARLEQVRRLIGRDFDQAVFSLPIAQHDMLAAVAELRAEIAHTRQGIADVASRLDQITLAPLAREAGSRDGGADEGAGGLARRHGGSRSPSGGAR